MTHVVTGCAGFIGSHLAESLLEDGAPVLGIDCFNDNYPRARKLENLRRLTDWDAFEFVPVDLAGGDLDDLLADAEVVYHLAAEPGVRTSWGARYERYLRNNLLATQQLLEVLGRRPSLRMVFASSSSVYGDARERPTREDAPLRPRSPYGQTKAAMEHLCELYRMNLGVDVVGLRYFTVFGPRQRPDMAFTRLCRAVLDGSPFTMFGDGSQSRDFTYVADAVAVTRAAARAPLESQRLFNVGGGTPATLREAIGLVERFAGRPLNLVEAPSERGDVRDTAADTALARAQLGFAPRISLEEGLRAQFEWAAGALPEPAA